MQTQAYPIQGRKALMGQNILLSYGGHVSTPDRLQVKVKKENGDEEEMTVIAIGLIPGWKHPLSITLIRGFATADELEDREMIWDYLLKRFPNPTGCHKNVSTNTLKDMVELRTANLTFISEHGDINNKDLEGIRTVRQAFVRCRTRRANPVPLPGDLVEGAYYEGAHPFNNGVILPTPSYKEPGLLELCAVPYTPWVSMKDGKVRDTSGGPFFGIRPEHLEYIGPDERYVCAWGHAGCCGNGAIKFKVKVNRWRLKPEAGI